MSSVTMNPEVVLAACEKYLAKRQAQIEERQEKMIAKRVGKRTWFGLGKPQTREEVIESLKGDLWNDYNLVRRMDGFNYEVVIEAHAAARLAVVCNKDVLIGGVVAHVLQNYF